MRGKHTKIELSQETRRELEKYCTTGIQCVKSVDRAKIILELDESNERKPLKQEMIADKIGVSRQTVNGTKKKFLTADSVSEFLKRKKRVTPPVEPKVTGELEAHIIAMACSKAPEGCAKWTLRLIAEKCVELNYVDSLSQMSVCRLLKKHDLSLT
jgi:predicted regulator of amino acid metabolism with ACT domain